MNIDQDEQDYGLDLFEEYSEDVCVDCGVPSHGSSWCYDCLDKYDGDIEEHEERKHKQLFEQQEY